MNNMKRYMQRNTRSRAAGMQGDKYLNAGVWLAERALVQDLDLKKEWLPKVEQAVIAVQADIIDGAMRYSETRRENVDVGIYRLAQSIDRLHNDSSRTREKYLHDNKLGRSLCNVFPDPRGLLLHVGIWMAEHALNDLWDFGARRLDQLEAAIKTMPETHEDLIRLAEEMDKLYEGIEQTNPAGWRVKYIKGDQKR